MEILKLLLNNSDTIIIGMLTCYLYDKIKNQSNGNKSDLQKYYNLIYIVFVQKLSLYGKRDCNFFLF